MTVAVRSAMVADAGARIRALRTARGLTQAQLGGDVYTKAYISMLEAGRTRASMKALEHIAGVLGVTPADLLGGSTAPASPQYRLVEALRLIEQGHAAEALPILESLEDGLSAASQLVRLRYLAMAYNVTGQPKRSFPLLERAQRMTELLGDEGEAVRVKGVLAAAYAGSFAHDEAAKLLRECVDACEDGTLNDPPFHFRRLVELGLAQANLRQSKAALATFERAVELSQHFDDRPRMGALFAGMAKAYHDEGDLEAAIRYNQRSLYVYEELGLIEQIACTLDNVALLYAEYGNRERALESLGRAATLAVQAQRDGTLASIRASEAEVLAKSEPEKALEAAQQTLKFARKVDQPDAQVRALVVIGELRLATNPSAARRSFNEAVTLAEARAPALLRTIYDRWSHAAEATADGEEALRLARRALEVSRA